MAHQTFMRAMAGLSAAAMLTLCGAPAFSPAWAMQPGTDASKPADQKIDLSKAEKRDSIIFRTGNTVDGVILDENELTVKILVIVGSLRSEATYNKSEILEIKRNAFAPSKEGDKKDADAKTEDAKPDVAASMPDDDQVVDINGKPIPPGVAKVYIAVFQGEMGRDVTPTPVKAMMEEIVKVQPDVLIIKFNQAFGIYGEEHSDFERQGQASFDLMEKASELDTLIGDRIASDPAFKVKPRQIAWIQKALGPAAFLPFVFPEIFFTSDGLHGGLGGLEHLFKGRADDVVAEKQISLRLGRARGLAEKGGHDSRIMMAMSRGEYILSYRIVGGQVEWLENQMPTDPSWFVLKDDGPINEAHRDTAQDVLRFKGNDYLTLDATTAFNIGFSKGTADAPDDLLNKLNMSRGYAIVKNKSERTFKEWSKNVTKAEKDIQASIAKYRAVEVKAPGAYEQRTAARGQQKNYLREVQAIVRNYAEAINPRRLGVPDELISQINIVIDRIDTAQRMDKRP